MLTVSFLCFNGVRRSALESCRSPDFFAYGVSGRQTVFQLNATELTAPIHENMTLIDINDSIATPPRQGSYPRKIGGFGRSDGCSSKRSAKGSGAAGHSSHPPLTRSPFPSSAAFRERVFACRAPLLPIVYCLLPCKYCRLMLSGLWSLVSFSLLTPHSSLSLFHVIIRMNLKTEH